MLKEQIECLKDMEGDSEFFNYCDIILVIYLRSECKGKADEECVFSWD